MSTNYFLAPIAFDRRGNILHCDVTNNYDTCGNVIATTAGEAIRFLNGTGRGPTTRSCGENHKAGRAYRTVAHHYTLSNGYRRVRPMFWTISEGGLIREVWSVTRKTMVFGRGTSENQPNWTELRRAELDARHTGSTPKEQTVTATKVVFAQLDTRITEPEGYYGTPMGINVVTWYQAIDAEANADLAGWTVSRHHTLNHFTINGPRGMVESVDSLAAAAEWISRAIALGA